jgi:hypothetical protein
MYNVYVSDARGEHTYHFETWREVEAFETALDELCTGVAWETEWIELEKAKPDDDAWLEKAVHNEMELIEREREQRRMLWVEANTEV